MKTKSRLTLIVFSVILTFSSLSAQANPPTEISVRFGEKKEGSTTIDVSIDYEENSRFQTDTLFIVNNDTIRVEMQCKRLILNQENVITLKCSNKNIINQLTVSVVYASIYKGNRNEGYATFIIKPNNTNNGCVTIRYLDKVFQIPYTVEH